MQSWTVIFEQKGTQRTTEGNWNVNAILAITENHRIPTPPVFGKEQKQANKGEKFNLGFRYVTHKCTTHTMTPNLG